MKVKFTLIFLLLALVLHSQEWDTYKNLKFGFRVDFPGDTKTITKQVPVGDQSFEMNMFYIENPNEKSISNLLYAIAHVAYSKEEYSNDDSERDEIVLNSAVNGAVNNVNGKLLTNENVVLNGFPGKQAKVEILGSYIYIKLVLVKHELYIAQVICTTEKDNNDDIGRFLESFDIIKTK